MWRATAAEAAALVRTLGIDSAVAREALMGGWAASRRLELQLEPAVRGERGDDGAGTAKFREVLRLVSGMLAAEGVESALLPGVEATWASAVAATPDGSFASLIVPYLGSPTRLPGHLDAEAGKADAAHAEGGRA